MSMIQSASTETTSLSPWGQSILTKATGDDPTTRSRFKSDSAMRSPQRVSRAEGNVYLAAESSLHGLSDIERMHIPANGLLLAAAINADTALVDELLQSNADPNTHDNNRLTALHHALFCTSKPERLAVVQSLLAAGADPNMQALDLGTPLHLAMRYGATDVVAALFARCDAWLKRHDWAATIPKDLCLCAHAGTRLPTYGTAWGVYPTASPTASPKACPSLLLHRRQH